MCQQYRSLGQAGTRLGTGAETIVQRHLACKLKTFARFARRVPSRIPPAGAGYLHLDTLDRVPRSWHGYLAETTSVTLIVLVAASYVPVSFTFSADHGRMQRSGGPHRPISVRL
jgi:hypothetical protein